MPRLRIGLARFQAAIAARRRGVIGRAFEIVEQVLDDAVLDLHLVGRGAVLARVLVRVEVGAPHRHGIAVQMPGDVVDHPLDADHALRPAEAAEGGVRRGVGLEQVRSDARRRQVVGIVGVAQGAIGNRTRQVERHAAAHGVLEGDAENMALVVEAGGIVDAEVVTLAGDAEIVVAVVAQHHGTAGLSREKCCDGSRQIALGLLAAERAAHAPDLDRYRMIGHAERGRDLVLDLGRVLRRAVDGDLVAFAGDGDRNLAFEVEVLLAADLDAPRYAMRRGGDGGIGIAVRQRARRLEI